MHPAILTHLLSQQQYNRPALVRSLNFALFAPAELLILAPQFTNSFVVSYPPLLRSRHYLNHTSSLTNCRCGFCCFTIVRFQPLQNSIPLLPARIHQQVLIALSSPGFFFYNRNYAFVISNQCFFRTFSVVLAVLL